MTERNPQERRDRLDEAIVWYLRLQQPEAAAIAEFTAWLKADPRNRAAFDRVEDLDMQLDIETVRTALREPSFNPGRPRNAVKRPKTLLTIGLGSLAAVAALIFVLLPQSSSHGTPITYATAVGQTKTITLSDASEIVLNTATILSLDITERHATLRNGEALFKVTHDPARPFVVSTGDRNVRDIGTVFDVLREGDKISVTVVRGSVGVAPTSSSRDAEITLVAGDSLSHTENSAITTLGRVDPGQIASWQQGYLIYHNAPLSQVVTELNRYFKVPIVWDGPTDRRFSGVLRIDDEPSVVSDLAHFTRMSSVRLADGRLHLRPTRDPHK